MSTERNRSLLRAVEPADTVEKARLARAIWSDYAEHLAPMNID
jgi:hypothetical protein